MSGIVFSNVSNVNYFDNDLRLMAPDYLAEFTLDPAGDQSADSQWPRGKLLGADIVNIGPIFDLYWYEWLQGAPTGTEAKYLITGLARDAVGNVLAGATVKCYRTSTDEMVGTATSDSDGRYNVYTPYSGNHYCVAYLAGAPDVAGTTVNTLAGV